MKRNGLLIHRFAVGVIGVLALLAGDVHAFPPAPHHVIYGMIRDEMGTPIVRGQARVFLQHEDGLTLEGIIDGGVAPGMNYTITIPMDSGTSPEAYRPTALRPLARFRIWVQIGGHMYLPIQMEGDLRELGQPAQRTRIDLTMGADSDGDGIPDAYKDLILAMLGDPNLTRADIHPDLDLFGTGMTILQHYISGTYPWDATERVALSIVNFDAGRPVVEFATIPGRTYVVEASTDLQNWEPVPYRLPESAGVLRGFHVAQVYRAAQRAVVEPQESTAEDAEGPVHTRVFRLKVQ